MVVGGTGDGLGQGMIPRLRSALASFPALRALLLVGVRHTVRGKPPIRITKVTSARRMAFLTACAALCGDSAEAARLHCTTLSHVRSNAEGRIEEADPADPFGLTWQTFDFDTSTLTLTNALPHDTTYPQKLQKGLLSTSEFVGFFRIGASPIGMLHVSLASTPITFSLYRIRDFLSGVCERLEQGPE